jgi:hypothetical protein
MIGTLVLPVPLSARSCGKPGMLSATARFAVSAPMAAGLNWMEIVQLPPEASVVPQVVADL